MTASASTIIQAIAPGYANNPNLATFVDLARLQISACVYRDKTEYAVALMTCHMMTLALRTSGEAGAVSSKSEGELSLSFGGGGGSDSPLGTTHYGQQLLGLQKGNVIAFSMNGVNLGC